VTYVPELEKRLQDRYESLVLSHVQPLQRVAAGLRALPGGAGAFAATQAAWRFWRNDRASLPALARPLLQAAARAVPTACRDVALLVHDYSWLHYKHHPSKADRVRLSNDQDLGYELQAALLLSDRDGAPVAPIFQSLRGAGGVYSSRTTRVRTAPAKLDRLAPVMRFAQGLGWPRPIVHVIDREADSVGHYRAWARRGHWFVVRADDTRQVLHRGRERKLSEVVQQLREGGAFRHARPVLYHGQEQQQWVAEDRVTLHRAAKQKCGRVSKPGKALTLRLVVAEVRDAAGAVLAVWLLLCHLPAWVAAATAALWYYWRWRVESYFKLLKGAGLHLEHWQQETAAALAKRLLVAAMACVLVWQVGRSAAPAAATLREVLVRLSGRQVRRGVEATWPALLAGLAKLLDALWLVDHYDPRELNQLLLQTLHPPDGPDPPPKVV
jgi:hypothetical protein